MTRDRRDKMAFFIKLNYRKLIKKIKGCIRRLREMAGSHQNGIVTQRTAEEKAALLFLEDTFTDQSQEMLDRYRVQLLDYCQKREYQVLVVFDVTSNNIPCGNLARRKIVQLVEKQYINEIIIAKGMADGQVPEIYNDIQNRKVRVEYLTLGEAF